jgi:MYXO-CTERM domain-containing protein
MVTRQRLLKAGSDVVAFSLLMVAIPFGLFELLSHQPTGRAPWAATATTTLLIVAGFAWGLVVFSLIRGVWAHLHHRGSFDSRLNRFAGRIAVAISLTFGFAGEVGAGAAVLQPTAQHLAVSSPTQVASQATNRSLNTTYTVRDGDCLWSIAERFYGDGRAFGLILDANFGQVFGRGERFDNPRIIRTGWVLKIPQIETHATQLAESSQEPASTEQNTHHLGDASINSAPRTPSVTTGSGSKAPRAGEVHATRSAANSLVGAVAPTPDDDHLLQTIGALGLGLLAGAFATRRRRALVDDDDADLPRSPDLEAALRLGDLAIQGGLVDAVLAELHNRGQILVHPSGQSAEDGEHRSDVASSPVALLLGQHGEHHEVALVKPGTTVSVTGTHRGGLVALQRLLATTWGEEFSGVSTSSPTFAADHVALQDPRTVIYFGKVEDLPPNVAERSVIVTGEEGGSLVVDVDEQTTRVGLEAPLSSLSISLELAAEVSVAGDFEPQVEDVLTSHATAPMIRLLTPVPRIDGLAVDLDRKRARRAVELASYLSLNRNHLVTGGQLRTELLGDRERDGSTKSLSNTVSALRRSLGGDAEGNLHLPPATRSGCYGLASSVTSDYEQVLQLLATAEQCEGDEALALVRAACALIEGRPLSSCVLGFDWFFRDGHERVLARALSKGVTHVLSHAIARGHLDLARLLIQQASLVNPYSETLARGAMSVAAATSDVDQLQQEWNEHLRRLEELEPGLSPSATTEAHFWRLHGVCAGTVSASVNLVD